MADAHHATPPTSRRSAPGADAVDQLPLRHPPGLLRADLHRHRGHAAVPRHPGPGDGRATCPAPTTRSPTSTTSRPRTPTPGCRCGSPATAGRASTPPPTCPLANPSPGSVLARSARTTSGPPPLDPHRHRGRGSSVAARRGPPAPAAAARHLGRPGRRRPRARRGAAWAAAVGSTRPSPPTAQRLAAGDDRSERRRADRRPPNWSSATPTAGVEPSAEQIAGALAFTRRFRHRRGGDRSGRRRRHGSRQGQRLVEGRPGGQQRPVGHQVAGPAEGQRRPQPVAPPVEGHQLALLDRPLDHHHLVVGTGQADHLDLGLVLIRPEEGDGIVGLGRRRIRPAGCGRRRPRPRRRWSSARSAAARPSARMGPAGHVPGRHHVRRRRTAPRRRPPRCRGSGPSPPATRRRAPRRCPPPPGRPRGRCRRPGGPTTGVGPSGMGRSPGRHPTPVRSVTPWARCSWAQASPICVAQHPAERGGQRLDHGDPGTETVAGGRHLGADEPGPDHHHPGARPGRLEVGADGQAVVEGAQRAHPGHARRCRAGRGPAPRWPRSARRSAARARRRRPRCGRRCRATAARRPRRNSSPSVSSLSGAWWWMRSTSQVPASSCLDSGGRS